MAKLVHITSVHGAADVRIFQKQCRSLAAAGHQVTLIVPHSTTELVDGVKRRGVTQPTGRINRIVMTTWHILCAAIDEDADLYHFHDPELMLVGLILRLRGKKVIYDVHEDTPKQVLDKHWIPSWLRGLVGKMLGWAESVTARGWSGLVTATPTIASRFPSKKTIVVNNYPRTVEIPSCPLQQKAPPVTGKPTKLFEVAYIGGISHSRGIFDLVAAIDLLAADYQPKLALAGQFMPASLEDEIRTLPGWQHVDFLGWQTHDEVAQLLLRSQVGVVPLHALPRFMESQPVKLYEYMLAGIPVIASDFPSWRKIVEINGCGLLVRPNDPQELAQAIAWVLTHPTEAAEMGRRGREAVLKKYHWQGEANRLLKFYRRILDEDCNHRRCPAAVCEISDHKSSAA